jgi:RsiW-degrading membrane proteinase PrsW (M82 family)
MALQEQRRKEGLVSSLAARWVFSPSFDGTCMTSFFVLVVSLAASAVLVGTLVYRYDLYDREPRPLVVATVVIGAGAMWLVNRVELFTLARVPSTSPPEIVLSAVASVEEELTRVAIVLLVALAARRHFNDPLDGLVYGSFAGLGMAIEESLYFVSVGGTPDFAAGAGQLVRLLGHVVLGGIAGFGLGVLRFRLPRWPVFLFGCLALAIALHFTWDWIVLSASDPGAQGGWLPCLAAVLMLVGVFAYGAFVVTGSEWSRQVFSPRRHRSIWGWPFTLLSKTDPD